MRNILRRSLKLKFKSENFYFIFEKKKVADRQMVLLHCHVPQSPKKLLFPAGKLAENGSRQLWLKFITKTFLSTRKGLFFFFFDLISPEIDLISPDKWDEMMKILEMFKKTFFKWVKFLSRALWKSAVFQIFYRFWALFRKTFNTNTS